MQAFKLIRNLAATCVALLTIAGPAVKANAQSSTGVKTVLLIHGAWADGSSWSKVVPLLEAKGLHVVAVQIPLTSFSDDVSATQRAIALDQVQVHQPVVLLRIRRKYSQRSPKRKVSPARARQSSCAYQSHALPRR